LNRERKAKLIPIRIDASENVETVFLARGPRRFFNKANSFVAFFGLVCAPLLFVELLTATTARGLARALAGVEMMARVRVQVAVACIVPRASDAEGEERKKIAFESLKGESLKREFEKKN
jgi:hypothetical protein